MVTMPVRAALLFGETLKLTVADPLPVPPDRMAIHPTLVDAVHGQPVTVVTPTDKGPPAAPIVSCVRSRSNWHGAPAWLTAIRSPETSMAPARGDGAGFGATLKRKAASPWPLRVPSEIHVPSTATDQVQSREAVTLTVPVPPVAE